MLRSRLASRMLPLVLALCLTIPMALSRTAAAEGPSNSITINPLGFVGWGPDIEYQGVINPGSAFALRLKVGGWGIGDWSNTALGGGASWRFFLQEENPAPRGLWVGPAVDVLSVTSKYQDYDAVTSMIYSIYGQLGYSWLFGKKVAFVLSPFLNLGFSSGSISVADNNLNFSGFLFGIGLAIGVAF